MDSLSGASLGTGFVILRDMEGAEVLRELVSSDGRFRIRAPRPGRYRLQSARIAYRTVLSPAFDLPSDSTVAYTFRVPPIPVQLSAVLVRGQPRCRLRPTGAAETALVWEEIEKALGATAWGQQRNLFRFAWYTYERDLNPNLTEVSNERGSTRRAVMTRPYTSLDPGRLATEGYVVHRGDQIVYFLPDAEVLLHDTFHRTHCFRVVRDPERRSGLIGLGFEPVPGRRVPDVRGVLWLHESTSRLHSVEVAFTRLPGGFRDDRAGGSVEFLMLPSGAWIVREWELRAPVLGTRPVAVGGRGASQHEVVLRGFRDSGGRVLEVATDDDVVYSAQLSYATGVVSDATHQNPLVNAEVMIDGTNVATRTDSAGGFQLTTSLEGEYRIVLSHPWLDTIGFRGPIDRARFDPGVITNITVAVPHVDSLSRRLCGEYGSVPSRRVMLGALRTPDGGRAPNAVVSASWQTLQWSADWKLVAREVRQEVEADTAGFFTLCSIPSGQPLAVSARSDSLEAAPKRVVFTRTAGGDVLFSDISHWAESYETRAPAPYPLWRVDLALERTQVRPIAVDRDGSLSGFVADGGEQGQPLASASVAVNEMHAASTREDGTFGARVAWRRGPNRVAIRRMGYEPLVLDLWVDEEQAHVALGFPMKPAAVVLEPVEVTGTLEHRYLENAGFYERKKMGLGRFLDRPAIEERLGAASSWADLLLGMPGVAVRQAPAGRPGRIVTLRGITTGPGAQACIVPRVFVDGFLANAGPQVLSDELFQVFGGMVNADAISAIEVYRSPAEIPVQYGGAESACGVILIWTGRGR